MLRYQLRTSRRLCMVSIDHLIQNAIEKARVQEGIIVVFIPHTTAAVTINENADPAVGQDILSHLANLIPQTAPYSHREGNSDAHIKSVLTGSSVTIIVSHGKPQLGTWQSVFFCEFDGPREREVWIQVTHSSMSSNDETAKEKLH